MKDQRQSKGSLAKREKWLLAIDVLAWAVLLVECALVMTIGIGTLLVHDEALFKFLGFAMVIGLPPSGFGILWLIVSGVRRLPVAAALGQKQLERARIGIIFSGMFLPGVCVLVLVIRIFAGAGRN